MRLPLPSSFPCVDQDAFRKAMEEDEKDRDDQRCLRGKYAPATGVCVGCGGKVSGKVQFAHSGLIGGSPASAYVDRWSCDGCGLMYDKAPPPRAGAKTTG